MKQFVDRGYKVLNQNLSKIKQAKKEKGTQSQ